MLPDYCFPLADGWDFVEGSTLTLRQRYRRLADTCRPRGDTADPSTCIACQQGQTCCRSQERLNRRLLRYSQLCHKTIKTRLVNRGWDDFHFWYGLNGAPRNFVSGLRYASSYDKYFRFIKHQIAGSWSSRYVLVISPYYCRQESYHR